MPPPGEVAVLPPDLRPSYRPMVIVLVGVVTGIIADGLLAIPLIAWWTLAGAAWFVWLTCWKCSWERAGSCILLVAIAAAGGAWHQLHWQVFAEDELARFAVPGAEPVCLEAVALKSAERLPAPEFSPLRTIPSGDRSRLEVRVTSLRDGAQWRPCSGITTLLAEGHLLGINRGDRVRIFGRLAANTPGLNPGQFDFGQHYRAERKLCVVRSNYPAAIERLQSSPQWQPARVLEMIRGEGMAILQRHLQPEQMPLAAALLLGQRSELDREQTDQFVTTGTIHLLVVSGMHVGMLTTMLMAIAWISGLSLRTRTLLVLGLVVLYCLVTGARPPVVRATVVVLLVLSAMRSGHRISGASALATAAIVVLLLNPCDLFRTGPQLSFLAVGTLIAMAGVWRRRDERDALARLVAKTRPWPVRAFRFIASWYWRLTLVSAAIWLVALPLVMARFHLCSPVAVILGPLLWVPLFAALGSGFALLLVGWISPAVGDLFGACCEFSIEAIASAVEWGHFAPMSHFWVPGPAEWWVIVFYSGLILAVAVPRDYWPLRWRFAALALWIAIGLAPTFIPDERNELRATFVSVGHGCGVLVDLPDGRTLLYDAGRLGSPEGAVESLSACLWERGATHLDAVVLSHADADHFNALPGLLERFSVGVVYTSPVMFRDDAASLTALREAAEQADVPLREIARADRLEASRGVILEVLHPPRLGLLGSDNADSIVLLVEFEGKRLLLTGDLESPGMEEMLAEAPLDCDIILAPHHGSQRSDPPGLAAWCTPETVVVSGGLGGDIEPVRQAFEAAGAQVLHTAYDGAVDCVLGKEGIRVEPFRSSTGKMGKL